MSDRVLRAAATAALLLCMASPPAWAQGPTREWSLRLPSDDLVVYRGVTDSDTGGGPGPGMVYPAVGGVAGLLVGILTHAAIVESGRKTQLQKMQEEADLVLQPHREQLAGFRYPDLLQLALRRVASGERIVLPDAGAGAAGGWIIGTAPVFSMTRDGRALVLDNTVALYQDAGAAQPVYSVVVRVVSYARGTTDAVNEWKAPAEAGTVLKEESAHLVAHSLEVAVRDFVRGKGDAPPVFRTVRYAQGGSEKMERAQPLETWCGRMVVRNLRGWLMSLPQPDAEPPVPCTATAWR